MRWFHLHEECIQLLDRIIFIVYFNMKSFSVWVFAVFVLWWVKLVKFSPLLLLAIHLILSTFFVAKEYDYKITAVAVLIILIHAKPLYLVRHHPFDVKETLIVLALYNAFLYTQGTTMIKEYSNDYNKKPTNVKEFILQA